MILILFVVSYSVLSVNCCINFNKINGFVNVDRSSFEFKPINASSDLKDGVLAHIKNNKIPKLCNNSISNLAKLEDLNLCCNDIEEIELVAFKNLPVLKYLDLSSNRITQIKNEMFSGLPALTELRLSENRITKLGHKCFDGLPISMLYLSYNGVGSIAESAFNNMPNLAFLYLGKYK